MNGLAMSISLGQVTVFIPKPVDVTLSVECYTIPIEVVDDVLNLEVDSEYTINVVAVMNKGV